MPTQACGVHGSGTDPQVVAPNDSADRILEYRRRAEVAERRVRELEAAAASREAARQEADALIQRAQQSAEAIIRAAQQERAEVAARERAFVTALRTYLNAIDQAETTLLRLTRRALVVAAGHKSSGPPTVEQATPTATERPPRRRTVSGCDTAAESRLDSRNAKTNLV